MTYILVVILVGANAGGVTTQEFNDLNQCRYVAENIVKIDSRLHAICFEKGWKK